MTVRASSADDEPSLGVFLSDLCLEARRLRFFSAAVDTARAAHSAADPATGRYGLVAHDQLGAIVGHAMFVQLDSTHAEVAAEVADHLHGHGLGTILIERLAEVAEQRGITYFVAEVLSETARCWTSFKRASVREWYAARGLRSESSSPPRDGVLRTCAFT